MSCPTGYSPASATDPTCVRDCVSGKYYADGDMCWPTCPGLSVDIGPVCTKNIINRTPLQWQTEPQGTSNPDRKADYKRRINTSTNQFITGLSNAAGCPPGYTAYKSMTDTYPGFPSTSTVKCFASCPEMPPGDPTQTTLNESGQCLVSICPNNEISGGRYSGAANTGTAHNYRDSNGNTFVTNDVTVVCDRSNVLSYKSRTFALPTCRTGKKAQFFDESNTYISSSTVGTVANTDPNYKKYFICTNTCPDGTQRIGNYCMLPCQDDGDMNALIHNDANKANLQYLNGVVYPDTSAGQARCLIKSQGNVSRTNDNTPHADTNNNASCPSGSVNVPRWKPAQGPDLTTTQKWAAFSPTPLYHYDTTPTTYFPNNQACVKNTVCGSNFAVGYSESVTSRVDDGNTIYNIGTTVYCAKKTCADQGFTSDPTFANLCLRSADFLDPLEEQAALCGSGKTLYGQQTTIKDPSVDAALAFENGIGYSSEITPTPFYISASVGVYSSTTQYSYDTVIGSGIDTTEYFNADGVTPWVSSPETPLPIVPNPRQGYITGPFFRCIKAHNGNGTSTLPTVPTQNSSYKYYQNPSLTVSNQYWTTVNIPTRIVWDNSRIAGTGGWKSSYCSQPPDPTTKAYDFCPLLCASSCGGPDTTATSGGQPEWNNDGSGKGPQRYDIAFNGVAGFIETVYESNLVDGKPNVKDAVCYPRCGSSGTYASSGNLCVSKAAPIDKYVVAGYSWCPNNAGDAHATEGLIAPSNPNGANGNPANNVCYSECPSGTMVSNVSPQTTCVTVCPKDCRFQDSGATCVKVPYLRALKDPLSQSNEDGITSIEQNLSTTASQVAKVGLMGGPGSLFQSVLVAAIVCVFLVMVLIVIKYQGAKFH